MKLNTKADHSYVLRVTFDLKGILTGMKFRRILRVYERLGVGYYRVVPEWYYDLGDHGPRGPELQQIARAIRACNFDLDLFRILES